MNTERALKPKSQTQMMWMQRGVSKIDHYNVSRDVTKMRRKGMSYMKIAKALNESGKLEDDSITMLAVRRWCLNNLQEDVTDGGSAINAYREYVKMLRMVDNNIDMINVFLDSVTSMIQEGADDKTILSLMKNTKDLHNELERYILRKQDLVAKIFVLQKEIINITTLNELLRLVLDTVKAEDKEIYEKVLVKLRKNQKFVEAARRMDDSPKENQIN